MINDIELNNLLEKINMYNKEEIIIFNNINKQLKIIKSYYETENKNKLEDIELQMKDKFKTITNIYNSKIKTITNTIADYQNTVKIVENIFKHIN